MALRLTEQQYQELLQQQARGQDTEYVGGRPQETRKRGHDHPAPAEFESPTKPKPRMTNSDLRQMGLNNPIITDIGQDWKKSKPWLMFYLIVRSKLWLSIILIVTLMCIQVIMTLGNAIIDGISYLCFSTYLPLILIPALGFVAYKIIRWAE